MMFPRLFTMTVRKELLLFLVGVVNVFYTLATVAVQRTPSTMCSSYSSENTTDCSFQINEAAVKSCLVYPTSVCRSMHYDVTHPLKRLLHESEASFSIGLQPYIYVNPNFQSKTYSALNITLKTNSQDITGFVLMLQQNVGDNPYNSCRIFDFKSAMKASVNTSISLFYDCYRNLEQDGTLQYNLIVRSLPNNEELHYTILIQKLSDAVGSTTTTRKDCLQDYIHLLIINEGDLVHKRIEVKYVSLPPLSNVTGRQIRLKSHTGFEKLANLEASNLQDVFTATFRDLAEGRYNITPEFGSWKNCSSWIPLEFIMVEHDVESQKPQWVFITIVCGVVVAAVLIIVSLGSLCYHLRKPIEPKDPLVKPSGLILYSYDCPKHHDVVVKLASHLQENCKVEIILDEWERVRDPKKWLYDAIENNNMIILILSQGVYHKCKKNNKPEMREDRPNLDLFTAAVSPLCNKLANNSTKLVKILFEYSDRSVEPTCFKNHGRTFLLPNQVTPFLCELHGKKPNYFPTKVFPTMPGDKLQESKEGRILNEAIISMLIYQKQNPNWFQEMLVEDEEGNKPSDSSKPLLHSSSFDIKTT